MSVIAKQLPANAPQHMHVLVEGYHYCCPPSCHPEGLAAVVHQTGDNTNHISESTAGAVVAAMQAALTHHARCRTCCAPQVVMTVMGQDAREIYRNQGALKQQLAEAAGVRPGQIYFYNQTANSDARTGVTAMSVSRRGGARGSSCSGKLWLGVMCELTGWCTVAMHRQCGCASTAALALVLCVLLTMAGGTRPIACSCS
jgi:hypothetical protein